MALTAAQTGGGAFRFGDEAGLAFSGRWTDERPAGTAAERTRGALRATLAGVPVWGGASDTEGVGWSWVELLEFLATSWAWLRWEETYPVRRVPRSPMDVESVARQEADRLDEEGADGLAAAVDAFVDTHDLARGLGGIALPPLRIVREGKLVAVATLGKTCHAPAATVFATLAELGDALVARLRGATDPRSLHVITEWNARERVDGGRLAAVYVGIPDDRLAGTIRKAGLAFPAAASFAPDELLAAARMADPVIAPDDLAEWFRLVRDLPRGTMLALDALSGTVAAALSASARLLAWEQGVRLARAVRGDLPGGSVDRYLDVEECLEQLGVDVRRLVLPGPESLDALGVWGPSHGPAVLVNDRGRHARTLAGRRATLAHELCHLLADRAGSLPLADVIGGRGPRWTEARANAFAAELLLPRAVVVAAASDKPLDPARAERLFRRFGVSRQLGAWQVLNSRARTERDAANVFREWGDGGLPADV